MKSGAVFLSGSYITGGSVSGAAVSGCSVAGGSVFGILGPGFAVPAGFSVLFGFSASFGFSVFVCCCDVPGNAGGFCEASSPELRTGCPVAPETRSVSFSSDFSGSVVAALSKEESAVFSPASVVSAVFFRSSLWYRVLFSSSAPCGRAAVFLAHTALKARRKSLQRR